jgi:hypothetical protein
MNQLMNGDIIQFNNRTKNPIFIGALALIDEVKPWGAIVFVNCLDKGKVYYRASFAEIDFIGKSPSTSKITNFPPAPSPATLPSNDEL